MLGEGASERLLLRVELPFPVTEILTDTEFLNGSNHQKRTFPRFQGTSQLPQLRTYSRYENGDQKAAAALL
jgi:hypothetical protein